MDTGSRATNDRTLDIECAPFVISGRRPTQRDCAVPAGGRACVISSDTEFQFSLIEFFATCGIDTYVFDLNPPQQGALGGSHWRGLSTENATMVDVNVGANQSQIGSPIHRGLRRMEVDLQPVIGNSDQFQKSELAIFDRVIFEMASTSQDCDIVFLDLAFCSDLGAVFERLVRLPKALSRMPTVFRSKIGNCLSNPNPPLGSFDGALIDRLDTRSIQDAVAISVASWLSQRADPALTWFPVAG